MQSGRHGLRFPATPDGLSDAAGRLHRLLAAEAVDPTVAFNVEVVFEEVAVNIVRYGRPRSDVDVTVALDAAQVSLTFEDDGVPFDPDSIPDPELPLSLDEAKVGGLGLLLVRRFATTVRYERVVGERNRLLVALPAV